MSGKSVIIGAGHMGTAIVRALLNADEPDTSVRVVDPHKHVPVSQPPRLYTLSSTPSLDHVSPDEAVVLAMPPEAFADFAATSPIPPGHRAPIISVMSGIHLADIARQLHVTQVVRASINMASEVFGSMTVFCAAAATRDANIERVTRLFQTMGKTLRVHEEELIDPASALCGDGPAFAAYFLQAMQRFAIDAGFDEQEASQMASQVFRGTADLIEAGDTTALKLWRDGMMPRGMTEPGIRHMQEHELEKIVFDALRCSTARSRELGKTFACNDGRSETLSAAQRRMSRLPRPVKVSPA